MSARRRVHLPTILATAGVGAAALLAGAPAAGASTTLDETIRIQGSPGPDATGYRQLVRRPGDRYRVRDDLAPGRRGRGARRRSLTFFAQLTDPQLADEMSPARVELIDPADGPISAAHRPQEALGPHVLDAIVRNVNDNRVSRVRQRGNRRSRLQYVITTGDMADNQQRNETTWVRRILDGGRVDPFSGVRIESAAQCPGASAAEIRRLNDSVAARRYVGVQRYTDYPGVPPQRYGGFWDPDQAPPQPSPLYPGFPRFPGLLDRAQRPFRAEGLDVPWYATFGNHDALVQGNLPASPLFREIATGCRKLFPNAQVDPRPENLLALLALIADPAQLTSLLGSARLVPPDPDRRFLSKVDYKRVLGRRDRNRGFGYVAPAQARASRGNASYYAFSPRPGIRMIALDSVATGGSASGNVDDPQYRWLVRELDRSSSRHYTESGRLVRDRDPDRLIVLYSHHTLETMTATVPDEAAGRCTDVRTPGCDSDPRTSTPLHLGLEGPRNIRDLLLRFPNVVLYVNGHTHHNAVRAFRRPGARSGFWQVNTASHVDWPQQSRTIEIMDNRDGTLSIFGTLLDSAAPRRTPAAGTPGRSMSSLELASLSRRLAASDPQRYQVTDDTGGEGRPGDRNVELLVRDPRPARRARTRPVRPERRERPAQRVRALTGAR